MRYIVSILLLTVVLGSNAQTLFTYGTNKVDKAEFWRAFTKNNTGATDEKAIREYLELFVRFKLKVQAAKEAKLDTLANIQNDIAAFRAQLAEQFMRNQPEVEALAQEALERSASEIEVAHVFVAYGTDSSKAKAAIDKAYAQLQTGADFSATASSFSTNDYVKSSGGYIGYVTVFTLPYELENAVYTTAVGNFSKPVASAKGYHIFKVLNKRASLGKLKAAQILIAVPANATQEEIAAAKTKAEMVYGLVQKGEPFEKLAQTYSDDKLTYSNGGLMPEFEFTKYDAVFSNAAFGLKKDGDVTAPVQTVSGFHIIKRIGLTAPSAAKNDRQALEDYAEKVNNDPRIYVAYAKQKQQILKAVNYKAVPYNEADVWTVTDTTVKAKNYVSLYKANEQKVLFLLGTKKYSVTDWLKYVKSKQTAGYTPQRTQYKQMMTEFVDETAAQYYKDRLEITNPEIGNQIKEFREGSLLFEIMERKIWSVAPADSVGLLNYYNKNKAKYYWQPSVNAIVFNCADTAVANRALVMMKQDPLNWKAHMEMLGGTALADSSRFELNQLPAPEGTVFKAGTFTPVVTNPNDGSSSFCYILKNYDGKEQRNFEEAKGLVINDYQLELEEKWLALLKKKYPVKVNEAVLKSMVK
ncbi:peptidyl-prolyl cis-trans isomerase SurA [Lacibacter cauensis]|uniref:Peptidyl-prolyl cis-trans isomerase SurA n=1 Tax=Lacibacter cauensis TaxID=510947 RepID=A0A562SK67_9BACT|nr:peptidylprolyl isomerase [Lacibacter cauensis]TWI81582.1 peptidyl-prolyl cis-trans isomerase SurA [Lacibacter cauensis]